MVFQLPIIKIYRYTLNLKPSTAIYQGTTKELPANYLPSPHRQKGTIIKNLHAVPFPIYPCPFICSGAGGV